MKLFKHTLLVIAAVGMLTACNDDGYWEPYNTDVEYYSFPKNKVEISMSYSEQAPATYDVLVPVSYTHLLQQAGVTFQRLLFNPDEHRFNA